MGELMAGLAARGSLRQAVPDGLAVVARLGDVAAQIGVHLRDRVLRAHRMHHHVGHHQDFVAPEADFDGARLAEPRLERGDGRSGAAARHQERERVGGGPHHQSAAARSAAESRDHGGHDLVDPRAPEDEFGFRQVVDLHDGERRGPAEGARLVQHLFPAGEQQRQVRFANGGRFEVEARGRFRGVGKPAGPRPGRLLAGSWPAGGKPAVRTSQQGPEMADGSHCIELACEGDGLLPVSINAFRYKLGKPGVLYRP